MSLFICRNIFYNSSCINPFIEDKEIYNFHYINSSVGLEGIVITKK